MIMIIIMIIIMIVTIKMLIDNNNDEIINMIMIIIITIYFFHVYIERRRFGLVRRSIKKVAITTASGDLWYSLWDYSTSFR